MASNGIRFFRQIELLIKHPNIITRVDIKYSMRDLICDVAHSAWTLRNASNKVPKRW